MIVDSFPHDYDGEKNSSAIEWIGEQRFLYTPFNNGNNARDIITTKST